ncbi:transposase [Salmonella enterica]|nr:transposase [Salmonella enterica]EHY4775642.1 transposase [Salmonella enterica]EKY2812896.1 transposase [Salmonella enterica]
MSSSGEIQRRNQDPFLIIYFCVKASQSKEKYSMTCPINSLVIDKNPVERALRAVCLGKKNNLFFSNNHGWR